MISDCILKIKKKKENETIHIPYEHSRKHINIHTRAILKPHKIFLYKIKVVFLDVSNKENLHIKENEKKRKEKRQLSAKKTHA